MAHWKSEDNAQSLVRIFNEVRLCCRCENVRRDGAARRISCSKSDLFVVMEAPSSSHVWRSGVQCFDPFGQLGTTGKNLEKFLNSIGYTVYPEIEIRLDDDHLIRCAKPLKPAYISDMVMCWPGYESTKEQKGNRSPTEQECRTCFGMGFLQREIEIIRPKVVLVVGKKAQGIFRKLELQTTIFQGMGYFDIPHPSGANGANWYPFIRDVDRVNSIRKALSTQQGDEPELTSTAR